jgi:hypothetical protein
MAVLGGWAVSYERGTPVHVSECIYSVRRIPLPEVSLAPRYPHIESWSHWRLGPLSEQGTHMEKAYRGTSPIRKRSPPLEPPRAFGRGLR